MQTKVKPRITRRSIFRVLILGGSILMVSNLIHVLMVWLMDHFFPGIDIYITSEIAFLCTCLLCVASILPVVLFINYRKRTRELTILSESIMKVAAGDYSGRIDYSPRDSMAPIYHEFNKMSSELSSVQFLKKDFINNFSHEFKTPIASIHGFASLMLERELPKEEQVEYLTIIKEESDRLSRLTSNTILLSKLSSQDYLSHVEEFNLAEQLRQCSIILSHQWIAKEQTFNGDLPDVRFVGSRELMQHLWLNLLGNAIRYTPVGGEINLTLTIEEHQLIVTIADNGEGMSQDTLDHLFIPYYQGKSSHTRQGLGLGMSIAKQITQLCEGSIHVDSIPNEGTTVTVTLPRH